MDRTTASHQRGPTVQLPVIGMAPPWAWYAGLLAQAFEACRTNAKGEPELKNIVTKQAMVTCIRYVQWYLEERAMKFQVCMIKSVSP